MKKQSKGSNKKSTYKVAKQKVQTLYEFDKDYYITGFEMMRALGSHQYKQLLPSLLESKDVVKKQDRNKGPIFYYGIKNPQAPKLIIEESIGLPKTKEEGITRDDLNVKKSVETPLGISRFFITSAHSGAKVHTGFLSSIKHWCDVMDGELVILPALGHMKSFEGQEMTYDPAIMTEADHFATQFKINDNLIALDAKVLPQQRDPLNGVLGSFGDCSLILASPQQRLETVPTGSAKLPRIAMTTGAITLPDYQENRIGLLATESHVVGGIIVEVFGKKFFARHVQATEDGSFIDIVPDGTSFMFKKETATQVQAEGMVLGDIHAGQLDMEVWEAWKDVISKNKPKYVVLHDLFDGSSINPHCIDKPSVRANHQFLTLESELAECKRTLEMICDFVEDYKGRVIVVRSNHDQFLDRYLESGRWFQDTPNVAICAEMFAKKVRGGSPLRDVCDPQGRTIWLTDREDYLVGGYSISNHGHLGIAGSKGNLQQFSNVSPSVIGHSHRPKIKGHSIQVGCSCYLQQDYNVGVSSWIHSGVLLYGSLKFSHLIVIDGKWHMSE
jgi:hypothetical protein